MTEKARSTERHRLRGATGALEYAGGSSIGPTRMFNEDALGAIAEAGVFVAVDGAYAQTANKFGFGPPLDLGRRAADLVVAAFGACRADRDRGGLDSMVDAALVAHRQIAEAARTEVDWRGASAEVVALRLADERASFVHVGRSRLYRARNGALVRMTLDHSLTNAALFVDLAPAEAESMAPYANVVTRVLGGDEVNIDAGSAAARTGDLYLLCTDGLSDALGDGEIAHHVLSALPLEQRCDSLLDLAETRGCENVSALLVQYRA